MSKGSILNLVQPFWLAFLLLKCLPWSYSTCIEYIFSCIFQIQLQSKKAVLTDWGLANIRDTVQLRQGSRMEGRAVGPTGGTFLYMAPECILFFQDASWTTDMWSLGATYLELFTRSTPWVVRRQRELAALMTSKTPPHALQSLNEKYHFLFSLLNYEPQSRPTASEVVEFLKSGIGLDLESRYGYKW